MKDNISIAKGLAIILMVIGHSGIKWDIPVLFNAINLFHMPLFIFVSGYCFKWVYVDDVKKFVWKRFKGLWWPYVKYGIIFVALHNVFFYCHIYNDSFGAIGAVNAASLYEPMVFLKKILRLFVMSDTEQLLGGFWFLKSLFWGSLFALISIKIFSFFDSKKKDVVVGALSLLVFAAFFSFFSLKIPIVDLGSKELFAAFFFLMGTFAAFWEPVKTKWLSALFLFVVLGALWFNSTVSLLNYKTWQIIPYCFFSLSGIVATLYISDELNASNLKIKFFLVFVGNNTLAILTWHFLCFKIVSFVRILCENRSVLELAYFPVIPNAKWWSIGYILVGVLLPLLAVKIEGPIKIKIVDFFNRMVK